VLAQGEALEHALGELRFSGSELTPTRPCLDGPAA
jgi:hypothetical protein